MQKNNLKLVYSATTCLERMHNNPRKTEDDRAIEKLSELIKKFGFRNPLEVYQFDDDSGKGQGEYTIICGNHRFEAGKLVGMESFPCIIFRGSENDALARNISDNKSNTWTGWDEAELALIIDELKDADYDIAMTGFDLDELTDLLGDAGAMDEDSPTPDDAVPAEPEGEPITQLGDLWHLGDHRILCGDATSAIDMTRLMGGKKANLVFTDPPYGMNLNTDFSGIGTHQNKKKIELGKKPDKNYSKNYDRVIGDDKDYDPAHLFRDFGYCKEMFLWGADYYAERIPNKNKGSWLVWDKRENIEHIEFSLSEFETCWSKKKHHRKLLRYKWFGMMGCENPAEDIHNRVHPNQKPVRMFLWFIDKYSEEGDIVVDPFLGSGSTLIACDRTGRTCYGAELFPKYCDVIINWWIAISGGDPVRHDGVKWSDLSLDA